MTSSSFKSSFRLAVIVLIALVSRSAFAADPIRFALIEPLSGPFANIGNLALHQFQAGFDRINAQGGVLGRPLQLVPFDNKSSPQDSGLQVQAAIDRGIRYIIQGTGSNNGHAVNEAIAKHNARNPDQVALYLNHGALDPALTDEKCHYWHFRFTPHIHMIMTALTDAIARDTKIKRVYLIHQDYVAGHSFAKDAKEMLAAKRPDIQIVGDDLHPLGKVKDFAPYISKVTAAKADAIVTGNWGIDLALLVKAANSVQLTAQIYAPLAALQGAPAMIGEAGADRVHAVAPWHPNFENTPFLSFALAFQAKYKEDFAWLPDHLLPEMVATAMRKAGTDDPRKIAAMLEGMRHNGPTGEVWMRAEDHQLMTPIYATVFTRVGQPGVKYDAEGTGLGWKTEGILDATKNPPPLICRIQRP